MRLSGWGRYPVLDCRVARLRRCGELGRLLTDHRTLIARGNGRAYGDAALNPALTLSMLAMDRMQAFDPDTGLLTCQAGVLLSDVLTTFVPRGWFPPVVPGTELVTVGGMIAADVHGKNHHRDGSFGAHVESLTLATADGEARRCSRSENADLFRATLGGMGLTGVILSASFRLRRIDSAFVLAETVATRDLDETMALFEASGDRPFSVAWIDGLARGGGLGRSLLSRGAWLPRSSLPARLAANPLRTASPARLAVPVDAPAGLLNRRSIRLFNGLYHLRGRLRRGPRPVHYRSFFFPLDGIAGWNRLYGRRGFVQYQCVLPKAESPRGLAGPPDVRRGGRTGSVPHRPQAVRPGRRGADVVPHGGLHPGPGLPDAPRHRGPAGPPRRHHPRPRRAGVSRQGRLHGAGARAAGLSPPRRVQRGPDRGQPRRAPVRLGAVAEARSVSPRGIRPPGPRRTSARAASPRLRRGGPGRDTRDRPDRRGHVGHRRTPPRLGVAGKARAVNRETILIVGATSDIGRAVARRFARDGCALQLAARNAEDLSREVRDMRARTAAGVTAHRCDVLDADGGASLLVALDPLPDVAVCVVGMTGDQRTAQREGAVAERIMRTNYVGPALLLAALAERFEQRGSGVLVGVSSVAGERGRASNYVYGSAKAGFSAFLSGLRNRLAGSGVHVVTIKPGYVRTRMTDGMDLPARLTAEPDEVARAVVRAIRRRRDVVFVRRIWRVIMLAVRALPERLFKRTRL